MLDGRDDLSPVYAPQRVVLFAASADKCFRKNSMLGLPFSMSNEIITFLGKEPIKQAASTLYSIQRGGVSSEGKDIRTEFPQIHSLLKMDFSFLDHHYAPALKLNPRDTKISTGLASRGMLRR